MRLTRGVLVLTIVGALSWFAPDASALCHAFTVGATASVTEGGKVDISVERDGAADDSSVVVKSENGTARAPGDFTALNTRVTFTGTQTQKLVTMQTTEDTKPEPDESFRVKLSSGKGCNDLDDSGFDYGDPALVTIKDDDPATPAPTPVPTPSVTPTATPSPTPTASPSPTPTGTESPTPTPSETPVLTPIIPVEEEDGGFPWLPVLAIGGFLAAAGGALVLARMRAGGA